MNLQLIRNQHTTCVGTGLVALDVILNGNPLTPPKLYAGGSCGNVMAILAFLGWQAIPIARLSNINATKKLLEDLKIWKVHTKLISEKSDGSTPVIIHRILKDKSGNPKHRFEFTVPGSNEYLPGFKPVLRKEVENIIAQQESTKVYYFDRLSRSSVDLAKYYHSKGALIVLEPTSLREKRLFDECIDIVHILKYSNDRVKNYSELYSLGKANIEIETKGKEGLSYRFKNETKWHNLKAFNIDNVIDTGGAGDWCTAGILHKLGKDGSAGFAKKNKKDITEALKVGQALGAINCLFDGARGAMYMLDKKNVVEMANSLLEKNIIASQIIITEKKSSTKKAFDLKELL
jgi:sugar/nucleoside kinase (ribokinase family)